MSEGRGEPEPRMPSAGPSRKRIWAAAAAAFAAGVLLTAGAALWWARGARIERPAPAFPAAVPPVPPPAMANRDRIAGQDDLTGAWEQETADGETPWRMTFFVSPMGRHFELQTAAVTVAGLYSLDEKELPRQVDLSVRETRKSGGWTGVDPPVGVKGVFTVEDSRLTLVLGIASLEAFERHAASFGSLLGGMAGGFKKGDPALKDHAAAKAALKKLDGLPRPASLAGEPNTLLLTMKRDPRFENPLIPGTPQAKREALDEMTYPPPQGVVSATWESRGPRAVLQLPDGVVMPFLRVAPGDFTLGIDGDETAQAERPAHKVRITKGYWLGQCEVTQAQWKAVMGVNPSDIQDDTLPVESVSWEDAALFIKRLNRSGAGPFRLPTEAEWVFACQAGNPVPGRFIETLSSVGDHAWCFINSDSRTHPVGKKKPNAWGFHDMTGNLWEWCADWYAPDYYAVSPRLDPQGAETGSERIALGGSWRDDPALCQGLKRNWFPPTLRRDGYGFRLCAD